MKTKQNRKPNPSCEKWKSKTSMINTSIFFTWKTKIKNKTMIQMRCLMVELFSINYFFEWYGKCFLKDDSIFAFYLIGWLGNDMNWGDLCNLNIYQRNFILSASFAEIHQGLHLVFFVFYLYGSQRRAFWHFVSCSILFFVRFSCVWWTRARPQVEIHEASVRDVVAFELNNILIHPRGIKKINKLQANSIDLCTVRVDGEIKHFFV